MWQEEGAHFVMFWGTEPLAVVDPMYFIKQHSHHLKLSSTLFIKISSLVSSEIFKNLEF